MSDDATKEREPAQPLADPAQAGAGVKRRAPRPPVVPNRSADDTDVGWGDRESDRDADILRERPPHW